MRNTFSSFLKELMQRRKISATGMASALGVSHSTVSRWLSAEFTPNIRSCIKIAEYTGAPLSKVLMVAGHLPSSRENDTDNWPEFRDYLQQKYSDILDEDLIDIMEDIVERLRRKKRKKA